MSVTTMRAPSSASARAVSAPMPRPDIAFNFEAPDLSRVLKVAGTTAPSDLGAVSASGGIAGTIEQLTLRDVAVNMAGQSVKATGTLAMPGASRGAPQSATYKGNLVLNGQAEATALGLLQRPQAIVGTVPIQHSYGFESTVLLALLGKLTDTAMQRLESRCLAWRDTLDTRA